MSGTQPPATRRVRRRVSLVSTVVLTVVWMLLWDHISAFIVLTGIGLAVLIGLVFPLPPIDLHGRFRPLQGMRLVARLLTDAFRASIGVVLLAFRFGTVPRSSIVRVQLRTRSDLYLTCTVELVSLVPGTIVLEVQRATSTLYIHVLGATDGAAIAEAAQAVLAAEARVLRALGSAEEVAALEAEQVPGGMSRWSP